MLYVQGAPKKDGRVSSIDINVQQSYIKYGVPLNYLKTDMCY